MTNDEPEEPIDHPAMEKYPDSHAALWRHDGVLYRVPMQRERDEAVPVPVNDLMPARTAIHQLRMLIDSGAGDELFLYGLGDAIAAGDSRQGAALPTGSVDLPRGPQEPDPGVLAVLVRHLRAT